MIKINNKNIFMANILFFCISFLITLFALLVYYQDIELPIKHKVLNLLVLLFLTLIPFVTAMSFHLNKKSNLNRLAIALNLVGIFIAIFLFSNQFYNQFIFLAFTIITLSCLVNISRLSFARLK
jgi:hypothetical protein